VTVAVLEEKKMTNFTLTDSDLKVEWFSGTGGGGQYRNKHQNSCRLIHLPTGVVESAQTRSRNNSYKEAFNALKSRIEVAVRRGDKAVVDALRKSQVGSGMRGDKIRTYQFKHNQVKDHVSGKSTTCDRIMEKGEFNLLWN
jgi:peptide chain release factor 1